MARVIVNADSLSTEELRAAIVAHRHAVLDDEAPRSITATDSEGLPFVGLNGGEFWTLKSVPLYPHQAKLIVEAIELAGLGLAKAAGS